MLTLEEAKQLRRGDVLVADNGKRWYVNGKVQTWKRDADRIRIPLKHGLYSYDALETRDFCYSRMVGDRVCEFVTMEGYNVEN